MAASDLGIPSGVARGLPRRRPTVLSVLVAIVAIAGVVVLLLPTIENWYGERAQSELIAELTTEVSVAGAQPLEDELAAARAYNEALVGGVASVAAGERLPQAVPGDDAYNRLLASDGTGLMGRIVIPAIGADLPIYHGTSDQVLRKGIGHLEGTALPVGGEETHAVLTGHRGLAGAELFTHLDRVRVGDIFTLLVAGETFAYEVIETQVVDPDETEELYPRRGEDLVTLVTCTPLGINSQRILVTGARVWPTPPQEATLAHAAPAGPGFPWWAVGLGAAVLAGAGYVMASARPREPRASDTVTSVGPAGIEPTTTWV